MSSEMRELVQRWLDLSDRESRKYTVSGVQAFAICADELQALLARTEAGADGVCDGGNNHDWRGDGICDRCGATYTHPQDASGDAEDARRYRWLRDKSPRTSERGKVGLFIGHGSVYSGFGQPYRSDLDEVVDCAMAGGDTYDLLKKLGEKRAAMQAKEAKS